MKNAVPLFLLIATSCTYNFTPAPVVNLELQAPNDFDPESAASLLKKMQESENGKWMLDLQKVRNSYAAVLPVVEDEQVVKFSVALFKSLALNEELDLDASWLPHSKERLPNTTALKFFYEAEKRLDSMISLIREFVDCPQEDVKICAAKTVKYFQFRKDFFAAIRDVDYRRLRKRDVPMEIPPEVLRAGAKMLEQRDEMVFLLTGLYMSFPRSSEPSVLPKPAE